MKHSLCSTDANGKPILFCNKTENKTKEACVNFSPPSNFTGCFSDVKCSSTDSVYNTPTPSPILKKPNRCVIS